MMATSMDFDIDCDTNSNRESRMSWDELESIDGDLSSPICTGQTRSQAVKHNMPDVGTVHTYNSRRFAGNDSNEDNGRFVGIFVCQWIPSKQFSAK
jgi:hypothetical protein